jgi:hypothetical protein
MKSNIITAAENREHVELAMRKTWTGRYDSCGGERTDGCRNHTDSFINELHQEDAAARHKKGGNQGGQYKNTPS